MLIDREVEGILCSCGGVPIQVETTPDEIKTFGCPHDSVDIELSCCVMAIECPKCKTRWTFNLAAPEME